MGSGAAKRLGQDKIGIKSKVNRRHPRTNLIKHTPKKNRNKSSGSKEIKPLYR
jgi:hypothetical protein